MKCMLRNETEKKLTLFWDSIIKMNRFQVHRVMREWEIAGFCAKCDRNMCIKKDDWRDNIIVTIPLALSYKKKNFPVPWSAKGALAMFNQCSEHEGIHCKMRLQEILKGSWYVREMRKHFMNASVVSWNRTKSSLKKDSVQFPVMIEQLKCNWSAEYFLNVFTEYNAIVLDFPICCNSSWL